VDEQPLALALLTATRRIDAKLLDELAGLGWPRLTSAQSLVFPHLPETGISPAGLARALGATRQSTQELVAGLVRLQLVAVVDDPGKRRGRLVLLTPEGLRMSADARRVLADVEDQFGRQRTAQLRRLVSELIADL
jgi:DNA-binding MarR family transcriptional regulator